MTKEFSLGKVPWPELAEGAVISPDHQHAAQKEPPLFSPDSRRLAYAAKRGGKWLVVVDGTESQPFDDIVPLTLVFNSDSRHLALVASEKGKHLIVVDGKTTQAYSFLRGSHFLNPPTGFAR